MLLTLYNFVGGSRINQCLEETTLALGGLSESYDHIWATQIIRKGKISAWIILRGQRIYERQLQKKTLLVFGKYLTRTGSWYTTDWGHLKLKYIGNFFEPKDRKTGRLKWCLETLKIFEKGQSRYMNKYMKMKQVTRHGFTTTRTWLTLKTK